MNEVAVVGPGQGEVVLDTSTVHMSILEDGSLTQHRLGVAEIRLAPRSPGPPQHRHAQHDEGFYVVSGTVTFTVGAQVRDAGPGSFVMVPTGAPHTFENRADTPAVIINTFTPDLYVSYFRELRTLALRDRQPSPELITSIMSRYATEPATDYAT